MRAETLHGLQVGERFETGQEGRLHEDQRAEPEEADTRHRVGPPLPVEVLLKRVVEERVASAMMGAYPQILSRASLIR